MSETEETSAPQEQPPPIETSRSAAKVASVASMVVSIIVYQLIQTFAPHFFSLELLLSTALIGIGTTVGYWLARSRFHHIPPFHVAVALAFGQATSMMVGLLLSGQWRERGLADLGVMVALTAWLFFRSSPTALSVVLVYQVLSIGARIWAMVGPGTVAIQIPWALSHGLAVWALINTIRPLKASLRPPTESTSSMTDTRPTVQESPDHPPFKLEELIPEPVPTAAASEPVISSPAASRPVQVRPSFTRESLPLPKFASPQRWALLGTGAVLLAALVASGSYVLGQRQGYAQGHGTGVIEAEKKGYEQGKKQTEERAKLDMISDSEADQGVAFLAGYDLAMHEMWEQFHEPMNNGGYYMIKVSNNTDSGSLLLAEDDAKRSKAADWVRFRLGILSDHKPPRLMIESHIQMTEGHEYELRGGRIFSRNSR